jgi:hypothetical protein
MMYRQGKSLRHILANETHQDAKVCYCWFGVPLEMLADLLDAQLKSLIALLGYLDSNT